MKISIKGFITSKEAERYSDCADHYAINTAAHRFAISDGVTRSYFPKVWSKLLVDNSVAHDWATEFPLNECQSAWLEEVKKKALDPEAKWFTRNAFFRNEAGLATLVVLSFNPEESSWNAIALGDSFMFFIPADNEKDFSKWIKLSSKQDPVIFDNYPDYLASRGNGKGKCQSTSGILEAGTFYLMTDALSEWMFNYQAEAVNIINEEWTDQEHFEANVKQLRDSGTLHDDDTSILIIKVEDTDNNDFCYDNPQVTDLDELIEMENALQECRSAITTLLSEADQRMTALLETFKLTDHAKQHIKSQLTKEYALTH